MQLYLGLKIATEQNPKMAKLGPKWASGMPNLGLLRILSGVLLGILSYSWRTSGRALGECSHDLRLSRYVTVFFGTEPSTFTNFAPALSGYHAYM